MANPEVTISGMATSHSTLALTDILEVTKDPGGTPLSGNATIQVISETIMLDLGPRTCANGFEIIAYS